MVPALVLVTTAEIVVTPGPGPLISPFIGEFAADNAVTFATLEPTGAVNVIFAPVANAVGTGNSHIKRVVFPAESDAGAQRFGFTANVAKLVWLNSGCVEAKLPPAAKTFVFPTLVVSLATIETAPVNSFTLVTVTFNKSPVVSAKPVISTADLSGLYVNTAFAVLISVPLVSFCNVKLIAVVAPDS